MSKSVCCLAMKSRSQRLNAPPPHPHTAHPQHPTLSRGFRGSARKKLLKPDLSAVPVDHRRLTDTLESGVVNEIISKNNDHSGVRESACLKMWNRRRDRAFRQIPSD